jgi:hypothetical protein
MNIQTTGAWINYFFRASPDTLVAGTNTNVKGIPRGAAYPQASTSFEKIRTDIEKYGLQDSIPWEDVISGQVNVRDQTIMRVAEGVVYAIDRQIWTTLTTDSGIQSFSTARYGGTHNATANGNGAWNEVASTVIMDDLEYAEQLIGVQHYDTENITVVVNLKDKRSIVSYLLAKGAQVPQLAMQGVNSGNGVIGRIGNKTFIVSDVVTASQCLVIVPQKVATWKELYPLTTDVTNEPLKDVRITAAELGVLQVDNPKCAVLIKGTQWA